MSDVGINYDATVKPSPVRTRLSLGFSNTTLQARVASIDPFIMELKPSGNIVEEVVSTVAYPLAQSLGVILPLSARSLIEGFTLDVLTIEPSTQTIMGEQVTVGPGNIRISNNNGMLMVLAQVKIT